MLDPKVFYRELDALLATIRIEKPGKNLLFSIMTELESNFGERLRFGDGRIYEKMGNDFILIYKTHTVQEQAFVARIPIESEAIQLVYKHRSYLYDDLRHNTTFNTTSRYDHPNLAAIWIHSPEKEWLFVFDLKSGWVREEISLFLNAVRTALNYRLFAELMGGRLNQAVQIQKSLLPKSILKVQGYQIFGRSEPAELVGGDFYDYFQFDESNFGVSLGDASGHGFPAALLVRDVVIGLRMGLAKELRIVHTVQKLNQVIQRSTYSTNFVSLFIGEIEKDGHLFFVNAGHPAPFIVNGDAIQDLAATGITLGFMPEIDIHRSHAYMAPNSVLVLYTDGIVERQDSNEEEYGIERLKKLVVDNKEKESEEILELIYKTVYDYGNRRNWEDDATVVVIKRLENH
jgi:sigma-B regulation protein RsbU (phosphoserine phosphatase)